MAYTARSCLATTRGKRFEESAAGRHSSRSESKGNVLETDGWPHGVTGVVADGDWIQLPGYRHHRICGAANSDGSGNATLTIYPRLRESPADNAAITVANTVGLYRMLTNDSNIDAGTDTNVSVQFTAVEAL